MPPVELRITRIGNSRGVCIPAETLRRYAIGDAVMMEERSDGIFLRPITGAPEKLSWAETASEMAAAGEDWSEWGARLQTVIVCPLTAQLRPTWRTRLTVKCGRQMADVAADRIRTISKARLGKKIGSLAEHERLALGRLLTEMYGS